MSENNYFVTLAKSHVANFPPYCVVCGASDPTSRSRIFTWVLRWWVFLTFLPSGVFSVRVPACSSCGWKLQLQRLFNTFIVICIILCATWYIWPVVKDHIPRVLRPWAQAGIALIFYLPKWLYDIFYPPAFDISATRDRVMYEFRDSMTAAIFALRNRDAMVGGSSFDFTRMDSSRDEVDPHP